MKRPAFMFYAGDWLRNAKLRRCSPAARGTWIDALCLFHNADEYGVLRWPLGDIANAIGAQLKHLRELVEKGVLKGGDSNVAAFVFTPTHAGKDGDPVTLIAANPGPCWYSSRMVRDEYVRQRRGESSRFNAEPKAAPNLPPKPPFGDGLAVAVAFASSESKNPDVRLESPTSRGANGDAARIGADSPKGQGPTRAIKHDARWFAETAKTFGITRLQGQSDADFRDRVLIAVDAKKRDDQAEAKRRQACTKTESNR